MIIRTGVMRLIGFLLLVSAVIDAIALNSNRVSPNVCQALGQVTGGCAPVDYTVALVLACVGLGLIVVSMFFKSG